MLLERTFYLTAIRVNCKKVRLLLLSHVRRIILDWFVGECGIWKETKMS